MTDDNLLQRKELRLWSQTWLENGLCVARRVETWPNCSKRGRWGRPYVVTKTNGIVNKSWQTFKTPMHCRCLANTKPVFSGRLYQHFLGACKGMQTPEGWGLAMNIVNFENQNSFCHLLGNRITVDFSPVCVEEGERYTIVHSHWSFWLATTPVDSS